MDHNLYHEIEDKAQILVDSLPYIRDFNQKIIIISFGCSNILTDEEEQEVMRDIALMKSIGMRPIVVHDTKMGHDKIPCATVSSVTIKSTLPFPMDGRAVFR